MEVRMSQALVYVGMLDSSGGVLSLPDLMKNFASTWEANGLAGDDEVAHFKAALEYFGSFVDIHYPVQSDKDVSPLTLTWEMIKAYFTEILAWEVDARWVEVEKMLKSPVQYQDADGKGKTWHLLHFEKEADANLYLSFVKSVLPKDMQHDLAQARIIKDRGNGYRFRMTLKQYSVFESQKQKSHASLDHLIKTLRGGEGSFFRDQFVKGITRSDKQRYSMRLRSSEKKE